MQRVIFLFFFLSGFSALIYEVAWVRILSLTLGNTAYATSTVLAVFMGGLALGAWLGGRLADRFRAGHLKLYGWLEIGVGLAAPIVTLIVSVMPSIYASLIHSLRPGDLSLTALRLAVSAFLLLLPCLFMGATLPAIIRYVQTYSPPGELFSRLYGLNTLGAAAGSVSACFLGFTYIGIAATIFSAAAINLVIGVAAVLVQTRSVDHLELGSVPAQGSDREPSGSVPEPSADLQAGVNREPGAWLLLALAFLTGFTALSYEVLWTRILRFYLSSITYTFTTMVSTFLLGLALGSFIYERVLYKQGQPAKRTFFNFAVMQFAAAILSLAALLVSPQIVQLKSLWFLPYENLFENINGQLAYSVVVSALCLLVPATVIGVLFPALGTLAANRGRAAGSAVGRVYAANTVGCVAGSLATGLILMPAIGSFGSFQWAVVLSCLTGVLALSYDSMWRRPANIAWSAPPLAAALLFAHFVHYKPEVTPGCQLLFFGEDANGTMHVVNDPKMEGKTLVMNGACLATTILNSRRYMRLLGHLPVLLHPKPDNVLVGCFGTGTTAGATSIHPEVKHLDIVELSPMVIGRNKLFAEENHNVLDNAKVTVYINDVRNYLLCGDKKYDIVTFEPPPPMDAGTVSLYSQEFYGLVKTHLNPGGIMCQWVPMDCGSKTLWKMMVATVRTVFPYVSVWLPNSAEAILVASDQPLNIDFDKLQNRIDATGAVAASLADVGLGDAMALASTFDVTGKELDDFVGDVPAITDDHPRLEFFVPYAGPLLRDLELEAPGRAQVESLYKQGLLFKSFDADKFKRHLAANRYLYLVSTAKTRAESRKYFEQALKLLPNSRWLKWVNEHQQDAMSGRI
jgi:spermidine synthase